MKSILVFLLLCTAAQAEMYDFGPADPLGYVFEDTGQPDTFHADAYGIPGCLPCEQIGQHSYSGFAVTLHKDPETHPEWVLDLGAEKGYPITTATAQDGTQIVFYGFSGPAEYTARLTQLKLRCERVTHGCVKGCPCPQGGTCICPEGTCPHCQDTQTVSHIPPARRHWSGPVGTRQQAIDHLLNSPHHRGHFSLSYLQSLSLSDLQRLHSHDHEGTAHRFQRSLPQVRQHSSPRVIYRSTPSYRSAPVQRTYYSQPTRTYSAPSRSYCPNCPR